MLQYRDPSLPTVVITLNITDTMVYNMLTPDQWTMMEELDPERGNGHNRLLYSVWNEKTNFMLTAAEKNYFDSDYFVWLDIGAVRHSVSESVRKVKF